MTWVKLDDSAPDHKKLRRAGPEAGWLWLRGLAYANRFHTDGRLDKDIFDAVVGGVWSMKRALSLAARLCEVRLWHDGGDHYLIHDYESYQGEATREEDDIRREYEKLRKREQRAARRAKLAQSAPCVPDTVPDSVRDTSNQESGAVPRAHERGGARDPAPPRPAPILSATQKGGDALRAGPETDFTSGGYFQTFRDTFASEATAMGFDSPPEPTQTQLRAGAKRSGAYARRRSVAFVEACRLLARTALESQRATGKSAGLYLLDVEPGRPAEARKTALRPGRLEPTRGTTEDDVGDVPSIEEQFRRQGYGS